MVGTLYQFGSVQFQVMPVNVQEVEHESGRDFASKDVVGARRPQEFVGPADEKMTLSGCVIPHKFDGLGGLSSLHAMAAIRVLCVSCVRQLVA
jgi:uncharacterized protein